MNRQARIAASVGVMLSIISGCSSPPKEPSQQQESAAQGEQVAGVSDHWVSGQENSMVLVFNSPKAASVKRCWPENGGYDCLDVGSMIGLETDLARYWTLKLPVDNDYHASGYRCKFDESWGNIEETISRDGPTLVGHTYGGGNGGRPWTKKYVEKFVKENGITNPNRYFDCGRIVDIVKSGSLESVNSTAVNHRTLGS